MGALGIASVIPTGFNKAEKTATNIGNFDPTCILIPSETAGPFPLDLSANQTFFRQDIREDRQGIQLNLKLKILGLSNCEPMPNLRVNIWHCDKDGNYSGYQTETGLTYLRGYQMTDANGEVDFITIFPGWYDGRICHIHFQVYVSSVYAAVSQLSFPIAEKNALYAANSTLYTKGADPLTFSSDNIFSDGYTSQLATLTQNADGTYNTYLELAVNGSGTSGLGALEPETGGQFKLLQNFPNPYKESTTIPFNLTNAADVSLEIWSLEGKLVTTISKGNLPAGNHQMVIQFKELSLPLSNYVYQLIVKNNFGTFKQCKVMTHQ